MTGNYFSGTLMCNGSSGRGEPLEEGFEMKKIAVLVGGSLAAAFLVSAAPAFADTTVAPPANTSPSMMTGPSITQSQVAGLTPSMGAPETSYILNAQLPPIVW